jgi:hypothetical protein
MHATNLAVFRVLVCVTWLLVLRPALTAHFALYPDALRFPPGVWAHLESAGLRLPVTQSLAWLTYALFVPAALAAILGYRTRPALFLMLLAGGYHLAVMQWFGKVVHVHHLLWFALLLAASPCADALAIDARATHNRARSPRPTLAYILPLRFAVLLIAIAYFFAGLAKLRVEGWATPTNFTHILWAKWTELGWQGDIPRSVPRVDAAPLLLAVAPLATIAFELLWGVAVLAGTWPRRVAISVGIFFHLSIALVMRIHIGHIAVGYAALIHWASLFARLRGAPRPNSIAQPGPLPLACTLVGLILVLGNIYDGFTRREDWPLGCYPTFAAKMDAAVDELQLIAELPDGSLRVLHERDLARFSTSSHARGLCQSILHARNRDECLAALWHLWQILDPTLKSARMLRADILRVPTQPSNRIPNA